MPDVQKKTIGLWAQPWQSLQMISQWRCTVDGFEIGTERMGSSMAKPYFHNGMFTINIINWCRISFTVCWNMLKYPRSWSQGLVNVPFWGYWTSPLNGNYRWDTSWLGDVQWWHLMTHVKLIKFMKSQLLWPFPWCPWCQVAEHGLRFGDRAVNWAVVDGVATDLAKSKGETYGIPTLW